MATAPVEEFMTIPEVAEWLRISRGRAYQMAAAGEIPTVKLSERRIRVARGALENWLKQAGGHG